MCGPPPFSGDETCSTRGAPARCTFASVALRSLGSGADDQEVHTFVGDLFRPVGTYLYGRRMYETMLYWESADEDPSLTDIEREFAALWVSLPKVVFSRTLAAVEGSNRLATGNLAEEVGRWRAEPGQGDIAIGGPTLAAEAAESGLIDEYGLRVHPVLVGGGIPFFPRARRRADLELVGSHKFDCGVMYLRYRVLH